MLDAGVYWRSYDPLYAYARHASTWLITFIAVLPALAVLVKFVRPHRALLIPGRAIVLMLVTLAVGPGIIANMVLKEHWGRPRPIDVAQFGGDEHFRPWWDPRGDCPKNCSFIAGEPAAAFWTITPAALAPPQLRALVYAVAIGVGSMVGLLRMSAGAHFFSDVVFAGVLTFLVIWVVHGWLYRWRQTRTSDEAVERAFHRMAKALGEALRWICFLREPV
jgi:membrane-associated PAP2 superfamily phosphatase